MKLKKKIFKGVWTLGEYREGNISSVSYELLSWGRKLADKLGEELVSVILGYDIKNKTEELISKGTDKVYVVDHPALQYFTPDVYPKILESLIREYKPEIFIAAANTFGRTIMPILAARLLTGLTADCTDLDIEENKGILIQTRPAIGGNVMATIVTDKCRPQMATVRPKAKRPLEKNISRKGQIILKEYPDMVYKSKIKFIDFIKDKSIETPIQEAEVIISGGKGLKSERNFKILHELSREVGGVVGSSRPPVDTGWIPYSHQIGLSGKVVSPRLYIAIGISGAVQHLAGMSSAKTIIAINKDFDANIFKVSDFGIVGDLFEIVPILIGRLRKYKNKEI